MDPCSSKGTMGGATHVDVGAHGTGHWPVKLVITALSSTTSLVAIAPAPPARCLQDTVTAATGSKLHFSRGRTTGGTAEHHCVTASLPFRK